MSTAQGDNSASKGGKLVSYELQNRDSGNCVKIPKPPNEKNKALKSGDTYAHLPPQKSP